jgi:hypothetical protein
MGVNPIQATVRGHLTEVRRNQYWVAVVDQDEVLVDVNPRAFHRIAGDAGDHFTLRCCGALASGPLCATELRKGERGTGEQDKRTRSGHGETPGLDRDNLLLGEV